MHWQHGSSSNPERSFVNNHNNHQLHQKRSLNLRIFKAFCQAMKTEYEGLLYRIEVRWLQEDNS
jgi:hypothetical protein